MPVDAVTGWTVHLLLSAVDDVRLLYHDLGSSAFVAQDLKHMEDARDQIGALLELVRTGKVAA